jgi:hypothetical protein
MKKHLDFSSDISDIRSPIYRGGLMDLVVDKIKDPATNSCVNQNNTPTLSHYFKAITEAIESNQNNSALLSRKRYPRSKALLPEGAVNVISWEGGESFWSVSSSSCFPYSIAVIWR